ncbi:hypothetical protein AB6A40_000635 [Gnathostoma spinigerum]|uniref:tRNA-guanine(15) transglycosylase-like domain-containing protein n=1 Tax=Gnathostoma spinigerum TaxID=75299 RepID=A0ABD6E3Q2_9BILA
MVKFKVENSSMLGRLGRISVWGDVAVEHETPSYLVYTRAGHIPHLTGDVSSKWLQLSQTPIYQFSLPSLFESVNVIKKYGKGVAAFCGMKGDLATHLTTFDPLWSVEPGFNDSKSVSIWTKAGRRSINSATFADCIKACKCSSYETPFDYDVSSSSKNKRLTKAVHRTIEFCEKILAESLEGSIILSVGGVCSDYHRKRLAHELGSKEVADGFQIDLAQFTHPVPRKLSKRKRTKSSSSEAEDDSSSEDVLKKDELTPDMSTASLFEQISSDRCGEMEKALEVVLRELPDNKVRLVSGPFDPTQVVSLVRKGIDLFDSSFAILCAEEGRSFRLHDDFPKNPAYSTLDFNSEKFAEDDSKLYEDCECYTCSRFTKAYIRHLRNTRELLSPILLVLHNMQEYDRMFTLIRAQMR